MLVILPNTSADQVHYYLVKYPKMDNHVTKIVCFVLVFRHSQ